MSPHTILYWSVYCCARTSLLAGVEPVTVLNRITGIIDTIEPIDPEPGRTWLAGRKALADALAGRAGAPPV